MSYYLVYQVLSNSVGLYLEVFFGLKLLDIVILVLLSTIVSVKSVNTS